MIYGDIPDATPFATHPKQSIAVSLAANLTYSRHFDLINLCIVAILLKSSLLQTTN